MEELALAGESGILQSDGEEQELLNLFDYAKTLNTQRGQGTTLPDFELVSSSIDDASDEFIEETGDQGASGSNSNDTCRANVWRQLFGGLQLFNGHSLEPGQTEATQGTAEIARHLNNFLNSGEATSLNRLQELSRYFVLTGDANYSIAPVTYLQARFANAVHAFEQAINQDRPASERRAALTEILRVGMLRIGPAEENIRADVQRYIHRIQRSNGLIQENVSGANELERALFSAVRGVQSDGVRVQEALHGFLNATPSQLTDCLSELRRSIQPMGNPQMDAWLQWAEQLACIEGLQQELASPEPDSRTLYSLLKQANTNPGLRDYINSLLPTDGNLETLSQAFGQSLNGQSSALDGLREALRQAFARPEVQAVITQRAQISSWEFSAAELSSVEPPNLHDLSTLYSPLTGNIGVGLILNSRIETWRRQEQQRCLSYDELESLVLRRPSQSQLNSGSWNQDRDRVLTRLFQFVQARTSWDSPGMLDRAQQFCDVSAVHLGVSLQQESRPEVAVQLLQNLWEQATTGPESSLAVQYIRHILAQSGEGSTIESLTARLLGNDREAALQDLQQALPNAVADLDQLRIRNALRAIDNNSTPSLARLQRLQMALRSEQRAGNTQTASALGWCEASIALRQLDNPQLDNTQRARLLDGLFQSASQGNAHSRTALFSVLCSAQLPSSVRQNWLSDQTGRNGVLELPIRLQRLSSEQMMSLRTQTAEILARFGPTLTRSEAVLLSACDTHSAIPGRQIRSLLENGLRGDNANEVLSGIWDILKDLPKTDGSLWPLYRQGLGLTETLNHLPAIAEMARNRNPHAIATLIELLNDHPNAPGREYCRQTLKELAGAVATREIVLSSLIRLGHNASPEALQILSEGLQRWRANPLQVQKLEVLNIRAMQLFRSILDLDQPQAEKNEGEWINQRRAAYRGFLDQSARWTLGVSFQDSDYRRALRILDVDCYNMLRSHQGRFGKTQERELLREATWRLSHCDSDDERILLLQLMQPLIRHAPHFPQEILNAMSSVSDNLNSVAARNILSETGFLSGLSDKLGAFGYTPTRPAELIRELARTYATIVGSLPPGTQFGNPELQRRALERWMQLRQPVDNLPDHVARGIREYLDSPQCPRELAFQARYLFIERPSFSEILRRVPGFRGIDQEQARQIEMLMQSLPNDLREALLNGLVIMQNADPRLRAFLSAPYQNNQLSNGRFLPANGVAATLTPQRLIEMLTVGDPQLGVIALSQQRLAGLSRAIQGSFMDRQHSIETLFRERGGVLQIICNLHSYRPPEENLQPGQGRPLCKPGIQSSTDLANIVSSEWGTYQSVSERIGQEQTALNNSVNDFGLIQHVLGCSQQMMRFRSGNNLAIDCHHLLDFAQTDSEQARSEAQRLVPVLAAHGITVSEHFFADPITPVNARPGRMQQSMGRDSDPLRHLVFGVVAPILRPGAVQSFILPAAEPFEHTTSGLSVLNSVRELPRGTMSDPVRLQLRDSYREAAIQRGLALITASPDFREFFSALNQLAGLPDLQALVGAAATGNHTFTAIYTHLRRSLEEARRTLNEIQPQTLANMARLAQELRALQRDINDPRLAGFLQQLDRGLDLLTPNRQSGSANYNLRSIIEAVVDRQETRPPVGLEILRNNLAHIATNLAFSLPLYLLDRIPGGRVIRTLVQPAVNIFTTDLVNETLFHMQQLGWISGGHSRGAEILAYFRGTPVINADGTVSKRPGLPTSFSEFVPFIHHANSSLTAEYCRRYKEELIMMGVMHFASGTGTRFGNFAINGRWIANASHGAGKPGWSYWANGLGNAMMNQAFNDAWAVRPPLELSTTLPLDGHSHQWNIVQHLAPVIVYELIKGMFLARRSAPGPVVVIHGEGSPGPKRNFAMLGEAQLAEILQQLPSSKPLTQKPLTIPIEKPLSQKPPTNPIDKPLTNPIDKPLTQKPLTIPIDKPLSHKPLSDPQISPPSDRPIVRPDRTRNETPQGRHYATGDLAPGELQARAETRSALDRACAADPSLQNCRGPLDQLIAMGDRGRSLVHEMLRLEPAQRRASLALLISEPSNQLLSSADRILYQTNIARVEQAREVLNRARTMSNNPLEPQHATAVMELVTRGQLTVPQVENLVMLLRQMPQASRTPAAIRELAQLGNHLTTMVDQMARSPLERLSAHLTSGDLTGKQLEAMLSSGLRITPLFDQPLPGSLMRQIASDIGTNRGALALSIQLVVLHKSNHLNPQQLADSIGALARASNMSRVELLTSLDLARVVRVMGAHQVSSYLDVAVRAVELSDSRQRATAALAVREMRVTTSAELELLLKISSIHPNLHGIDQIDFSKLRNLPDASREQLLGLMDRRCVEPDTLRRLMSLNDTHIVDCIELISRTNRRDLPARINRWLDNPSTASRERGGLDQVSRPEPRPAQRQCDEVLTKLAQRLNMPQQELHDLRNRIHACNNDPLLQLHRQALNELVRHLENNAGSRERVGFIFECIQNGIGETNNMTTINTAMDLFVRSGDARTNWQAFQQLMEYRTATGAVNFTRIFAGNGQLLGVPGWTPVQEGGNPIIRNGQITMQHQGQLRVAADHLHHFDRTNTWSIHANHEDGSVTLRLRRPMRAAVSIEDALIAGISHANPANNNCANCVVAYIRNLMRAGGPMSDGTVLPPAAYSGRVNLPVLLGRIPEGVRTESTPHRTLGELTRPGLYLCTTPEVVVRDGTESHTFLVVVRAGQPPVVIDAARGMRTIALPGESLASCHRLSNPAFTPYLALDAVPSSVRVQQP